MWTQLKSKEEAIGKGCTVLGLLFLIVFFFNLTQLQIALALLGASLGLFSIGLTLMSIGSSARSHERHTDLLRQILNYYEPQQDRMVSKIPQIIRPQGIPSEEKFGKPTVTKGSKEYAQSRLDEDTKKVGYTRGELYQLKDSSWGIAWGGEYPL